MRSCKVPLWENSITWPVKSSDNWDRLTIITVPFVQLFPFLIYFICCWSFSCYHVVIPGLLEISPVERGVVTLYGVRSGLFIAMSDKGKLYGSVRTDRGFLCRRFPQQVYWLWCQTASSSCWNVPVEGHWFTDIFMLYCKLLFASNVQQLQIMTLFLLSPLRSSVFFGGPWYLHIYLITLYNICHINKINSYRYDKKKKVKRMVNKKLCDACTVNS